MSQTQQRRWSAHSRAGAVVAPEAGKPGMPEAAVTPSSLPLPNEDREGLCRGMADSGRAGESHKACGWMEPPRRVVDVADRPLR